jgi:UDP-N-acetylmuramate--alanine ligase
VVTNIDPEHLDHYGDFDAVRAAFRAFVGTSRSTASPRLPRPPGGAVAGAQVGEPPPRHLRHNPQAEVQARNVSFSAEGARFDVRIEPREGEATTLEGLRLADDRRAQRPECARRHRRRRELGSADAALRKGLARFGGVRRRFTPPRRGERRPYRRRLRPPPCGDRRLLRAARQVAAGKVIAVVQRTRYTALRDLFAEFSACFNDADTVIVADVYAAARRLWRASAGTH